LKAKTCLLEKLENMFVVEKSDADSLLLPERIWFQMWRNT